MKSVLRKMSISDDHVFELKHLIAPHFDPNWHFHNEYQLFVVLKGTGTCFIGDNVRPFAAGDLVFTGPNLPHLWRSDASYFENNTQQCTEGIVLYFREEFLGSDFLKKHETYKIKQVLQKSHRGMRIMGASANAVVDLLKNLTEQTDFNSILHFLHLLDYLSQTEEYQLLASEGYSHSMTESDSERMNKVHEYVMRNFHDNITLEVAAELANMTPSSFSRYFKQHANKTFSDFVSEIRIGHSCKLLMEDQKSISEICYESGFNTLSNFNRQFKDITHYTPMDYRKKYSV